MRVPTLLNSLLETNEKLPLVLRSYGKLVNACFCNITCVGKMDYIATVNNNL